MRIKVRGTFQFYDLNGAQRTPSGQKERAILAILALTPDLRRSRKWLQETLWSNRFSDQSSTSLRRAIYNIRKTLGPASTLLKSNRSDLWFEKSPIIDWGLREEGALLEDIHIEDPSFQNWVNKLRFNRDGEIVRRANSRHAKDQSEKIVIHAVLANKSAELRFLTRRLTDDLAKHFKAQGPIEVDICDHDEEIQQNNSANVLWRIEVDSAQVGEQWMTHVRAFREHPRRYLWSGRLQLPFDLEGICNGFELVDFIGQAVLSIRAGDRSNTGVYPNLLTASQKVFLSNRDELELADRIFSGLEAEDQNGVVQAWRSFIGLTRILEHGEASEKGADEAMAFARNSEKLGFRNPLTVALAAQVTMKIGNDTDRGAFLAQQAHEFGETNPYALHAMSQASLLRGEFLAGYKYAENGRRASSSLPNSYFWDMQTCLAALGIGKRQTAYKLAHFAHIKMPSYRPALRYLAALSFLDQRPVDGEKWCTRLQDLEPQFQAAMLLTETYPIDTFRILGLQEELASMWQP